MSQNLEFAFDPHAWLMDDKLGLCSFVTKGIWIDMICWMHKSKRRGYLVVNGKSLSKDEIRKLLKSSEDEFDKAWKELVVHGVISQHPDGTYYSKRVVTDVERSKPQYGLSKEDLDLIDMVLKEFDRLAEGHAPYNVKEAKDLIAFRIRYDGAKLEDFVTVIKGKYREWSDNDKMRTYIRPRTLFGERFTSYLHELSPKPMSAVDNGKVVPRFDYGDL